MKIGFAYLTYKGTLPYTLDQPVDYRYFGKIVSKDRAPKHCPRIYFELPISRPVTTVLWHADLGNGTFTTRPALFLWVGIQMYSVDHEHLKDIGFYEPRLAMIMDAPPRELVLQLGYAIKIWEPFTTLVAASKLLPVMLNMESWEREDFLKRIGQGQNERTLRVAHQKAYIANCWIAWENAELCYADRVRDMQKNGVQITLGNFKKLVNREMKLKPHFIE